MSSMGSRTLFAVCILLHASSLQHALAEVNVRTRIGDLHCFRRA